MTALFRLTILAFVHLDGSFVNEPNANGLCADEFMCYTTDESKYSKSHPGNGICQVDVLLYGVSINDLRILNSTGRIVKIINDFDEMKKIDLINQYAGVFYIKYH